LDAFNTFDQALTPGIGPFMPPIAPFVARNRRSSHCPPPRGAYR
jgi:hypothetical protein